MNTKRASERVKKEVAYITEMIFQFCFYLYFAVLGYDFSCIKYFIFTILVYNTNPHNDHPQVDLFSSSSKRATPATWVRIQYNAIQCNFIYLVIIALQCNAIQCNTIRLYLVTQVPYKPGIFRLFP